MTRRVVCRHWSVVYPPKSFLWHNTPTEVGTTRFSTHNEFCYPRATCSVNLLQTIVTKGGRYQQLIPYPTEAKGNVLDVFLNISFQKLSHLSTAVTLSLENFVHFAVLPDLSHRCRNSHPEPCATEDLLQDCYSEATDSFGEVFW